MATNDKRRVTNEDILKYEALVQKFIRDSCMKNWSEARTNKPTAFLGSSGWSLQDIQQHLRTEVCVALQNYNPAYVTKDGKTVKESTFVYNHLTFRVGQMMKRLTKRRTGYGIRHNPFDLILKSGTEQSVVDLDLANAFDHKRDLESSRKSQVEKFLEKKRS